MTGFLFLAVTQHPQLFLNIPLSHVVAVTLVGTHQSVHVASLHSSPVKHCCTEGEQRKPLVAASSLKEAILGGGEGAMLGVLCASVLSPPSPPYPFFAIS